MKKIKGAQWPPFAKRRGPGPAAVNAALRQALGLTGGAAERPVAAFFDEAHKVRQIGHSTLQAHQTGYTRIANTMTLFAPAGGGIVTPTSEKPLLRVQYFERAKQYAPCRFCGVDCGTVRVRGGTWMSGQHMLCFADVIGSGARIRIWRRLDTRPPNRHERHRLTNTANV